MGQIKHLKNQIDACSLRISLNQAVYNQSKNQIKSFFNGKMRVFSLIIAVFATGFFVGYVKWGSKLLVAAKKINVASLVETGMVAYTFFKRTQRLLGLSGVPGRS